MSGVLFIGFKNNLSSGQIGLKNFEDQYLLNRDRLKSTLVFVN
jgi:hypothetical protein